MNYFTIENILSQNSPPDLPKGMKADGGGTEQRRQVTLFTASGFSALQPSPQTSGRGRKRSCSMKAELTVAANFNGELQGLPPAALALKQKIPRPPNAFMLFANDWRRKLASQFPKESNKDISIRLGGMWKNMDRDEKEKYFQFAREVDAAHKKKYPDYVYNPKEARMRKALREQSRGERQGAGQEGGGSGQHRGGGGPASWAKHRHIINHRQPIMVGEQTLHHSLHHHHQSASQRGVEDVTALNCKLDSSPAGGGMIQNFSDYLSDLSYPVTQPNEYIVPDLDQSWYSYLQGPVQNAAYLMRTPSDKAVTSNDWGTHFSSENAASISSNTQNGPGNGGFLNSSSTFGSRDQQQLVNGSASGHQTPNQPINSPAVEKTIVMQDHTNNNEMKDSNGKPLLLSQIKIENQNGVDGSISKDALRLPAFQQAFGSTEIGRFSQHEGFFESSLPQPEAQPEPKNIPEPVTPPRNKLPDVDFQNPASYILSPSTNMSPSMWGPLLYSPTTKDGSSCFGSPTFPQQSPLTNFIDYSLLSGTEFMQSGNDEIIDLSSHCSANDHASVSGSNNLYSNEEKELQILLSGENGSTNTGDNTNNNHRNNGNCENVFSGAIKPLQKITDASDKTPVIMEVCRRASQELQDMNNPSFGNKINCYQNRIRSVEEFADQDLKMNCVNRPPVIISENEKICVILESSNVGLDSCSGANATNSINNKQFTNL